MENHSFEEIKIIDICNQAMINRSTFYDHYNDKYELLIDYINNEKKMLEDKLDENVEFSNTKEYYISLIKLLLNHVDNLKDTYHEILMHNQNSIIMDIFMDTITKDVEKRINNNINDDLQSKIITKFYVGAVVNVCMEWLKNTNSFTKEELLNHIEKLIPDNIN